MCAQKNGRQTSNVHYSVQKTEGGNVARSSGHFVFAPFPNFLSLFQFDLLAFIHVLPTNSRWRHRV